jgi:hypothetical protein
LDLINFSCFSLSILLLFYFFFTLLVFNFLSSCSSTCQGLSMPRPPMSCLSASFAPSRFCHSLAQFFSNNFSSLPLLLQI